MACKSAIKWHDSGSKTNGVIQPCTPSSQRTPPLNMTWFIFTGTLPGTSSGAAWVHEPPRLGWVYPLWTRVAPGVIVPPWDHEPPGITGVPTPSLLTLTPGGRTDKPHDLAWRVAPYVDRAGTTPSHKVSGDLWEDLSRGDSKSPKGIAALLIRLMRG